MAQNPNDPEWTCPVCQKKPVDDNFRILFTDTKCGVELYLWVKNPTPGLCWDLGTKPIATAGDMLGHIDVWEGCFMCFSERYSKDPMSAFLFKSVWTMLLKSGSKVPRLAGHAMHFRM